MRLELPLKIDRKNWLQRVGINPEDFAQMQRDANPELENVMGQMDIAEEKLFKAAMPQGIFRFMPLDDMVKKTLGLEGNAIKKHLEGCSEIVIMGATLGVQTDQLIRTSQIRDMAEAVFLDSGASILIEQICDQLEEKIKDDTDMYLTGRYSPGYGDYPIDAQSRLIRTLDAQRKIGLTVNESHIMIPRKSVTAIIGAADHPVKGYLASCEECTIKDKCILRKEGKNCAEF